MKKFLLSATAIGLVTFMSAAASPAIPAILQKNDARVSWSAPKKIADFKKQAAESDAPEPKDNYDEHAKYCQIWYMGKTGTDASLSYYLTLMSTVPIDESGNPAEPGYMTMAYLVADTPDEGSEIQVPVGTYVVNDSYGKGTAISESTKFLHAFVNPDDPASGQMVAYQYKMTEGSLSIAPKKDCANEYDLAFTGYGENWSYDDNYDRVSYGFANATMDYSGPVEIQDHDPAIYTPITENMVADTPNLSGRYEDGYVNLAFYSDGLLDDEGWIIDAGQLFVAELMTKQADKDFSFAGEYNYFDYGTLLETGSPAPENGDLFGGVWYSMYGNYIPIGTNLCIYDAGGNITAVGLSGPGSKLTVTEKNNGIYNLSFDITTLENVSVKLEWEGVLADYVLNFPDTSGIDNIMNEADDESAYYNLQGVRVDKPAEGLFIRVRNGQSSKVLIR